MFFLLVLTCILLDLCRILSPFLHIVFPFIFNNGLNVMSIVLILSLQVITASNFMKFEVLVGVHHQLTKLSELINWSLNLSLILLKFVCSKHF